MLEVFKTIIKKKGVENGIWLYLLQIFNTIIPILTLPYITRVLSPSEFGEVTIAINILGYFQAIVEYGFGMSATRKIALIEYKDEDRENSINSIFTGVFFSRIILFVLCLSITLIYISIGRYTDRRGVCLIILDTTLIGNVLQLNWLFQGKQDMKYISLSNIVARTAVVIGIFIVVKTPDDIYKYCVLTALSPVIASCIGMIIAKRKYRIRLLRISIKDIIAEMRSGWYVFTTQLSAKVFGAIGITFLGIWATSYEVGIYSAIQKIPYVLTLAWSPISQVLYPISSRYFSMGDLEGLNFVRKVRRYTLLVFGAGVSLLAVLVPFIVRIAFGEKYITGTPLVYPLLIWVLLGINNNFLGIQILLASGRDKEYSSSFQIGVLCTILLNAILIFFWHSTGAAIAPMLSEAILSGMLYYNVKKLRILS